MSKSRSAVFMGSLQPKKKQELQEISDALGLPSSGSTKDDLVKLIKTHLEDNETKHISNPQFTGLYPSSRRKKSLVPASTSHATLIDDSDEEVIPRREPASVGRPSRPSGRAAAPPALATPESFRKSLPQISESPKSSPGITYSPRKILPPPVDSPIRAVLPEAVAAIPEVNAMVKAAEQSGRQLKVDVEEAVVKTRTFLSNSANIATLTVLAELFTILYTIIPWSHLTIPIYNWPTLSIPYPPSSYLKTSELYATLFFWALPTLLIPECLGRLISFTEPRRDANPLSAAIVRVACASAGGWAVGDNVLGRRWRVLGAATTLAFAFAEALGEGQKLTKVAFGSRE